MFVLHPPRFEKTTTVEYCAGIRAFSGVTKQSVLPTNHERFDSALRAVVVDVQLTIGGINGQFFPLIRAIRNRFT